MRQHDESEAAPNEDDVLVQAAGELRRPLRIDAALFDARVMDEVLRGPTGLRERMAQLARPRTIRVSPLAALAAALVFAVAIAGSALYLSAPRGHAVTADIARTGSGSPLVQFGFVAPHASSVALVGDFNNWDPKATPLRAASTGGVWSVEVPIQPGRHLYAFVVDGSVWHPDPAAPQASGEDYGEPNSALTVAEPGAR
ncbi:MAG TPA: isoamylase early set domain-containing protein [Gemmatimonadaceae bacterium]